MNLGGKQLRGRVNGLPVGLWAALAMVGLGFWLHSTGTLVPIAGAAVAGSVLFFVLTNFGVWALGSLYPTTGDGLLACSVAAIPFFRTTLLDDAVDATVLFGGLALAEKRFPVVRGPELSPAG